MNLPDDIKYTKDHEWTKLEGNVLTIGITDYAQSELGDIAWVELPKPGTEIRRGAAVGTIEAVKTVEDLFAPVDGKVLEVNDELTDSPELVNEDPYGGGWMVKIECSDLSQYEELLSADGYRELIS